MRKIFKNALTILFNEMVPDLSIYPGGDLVMKGLRDLQLGIASEEALLVSIASSRLEGLGLKVPHLKDAEPSYEISLYSLIEERNPSGAHSAYNALIRRIVSFARAYSVRQ